MKPVNAKSDFVAIILILTLPFIEFIYTKSFVFEFVNVVILAIYAAIALAITFLLTKYPNRLFRSFILTLIIVQFLDVRINIFRLISFEAVLLMTPILFFALWLLYKKANTILIAVFGGIFVGVFFQPVFPKIEEYPVANPSDRRETPNLPVYVHIILDAHIGIEPLDDNHQSQKELKQSARNLFIDNGFRLFGRAYSEYASTFDSLTSALNSYRGLNPNKQYIYDKNNNVYTLTENKYFQDLYSSGYDIRVYQTSFLNFCQRSREIVRYCHTYTAFDASSPALAQLDLAEKLDVIYALFGVLYTKRPLWLTYTHIAAFSARYGIALPAWNSPPDTDLGPISTLPVFDQLISDIASGGTGKMYFAHLLIPHHPYSVDRNCDIRRPVANWKKAQSTVQGNNRVNTEKSRSRRYNHYAEQAQCALVKVDKLIDTMKSAGTFDDATIVIHGDHGSRISQLITSRLNENTLQPQDFYDGFSVLFAIKAPHVDAGYDLRMLPLERLLRLVESEVPVDLELSDDHFVYLRDKRPTPGDVVKVPMPEIPGGSHTPRKASD